MLQQSCRFLQGCWHDIPRTRTTLGDRSFTAAGPRLWNILPLHICDCELSLLEFRRLLKMQLFGWGWRHLVTYSRRSVLYKCTYLLTYLLYCNETIASVESMITINHCCWQEDLFHIVRCTWPKPIKLLKNLTQNVRNMIPISKNTL